MSADGARQLMRAYWRFPGESAMMADGAGRLLRGSRVLRTPPAQPRGALRSARLYSDLSADLGLARAVPIPRSSGAALLCSRPSPGGNAIAVVRIRRCRRRVVAHVHQPAQLIAAPRQTRPHGADR